MGSDSQASVAKRASGTFPGFAMPALPTASADSSMSAVELFCRNGSSSARSSLDSQEQQSGRTPSLPAPDMLCSSAAALPPIGPTPSGTVQAAAAAASAAAAAFRAMYGGAALGGRRPSIALVPLEAVQLTIQPLDMTSRGAAAGAGAACAAAADALRALSGASQSGSSVLQMLRRASNTAASEATEQQGPAEGSGAGCALRTTSAGGGHSSDDTQSRSLVFSRHPAPTAPSADTDGPQSRAALATANRRSALLRFRRKREARTFDKKVRYVSRKRLAEARPRVRGQFVKAEVAAAFFAAQKAETEPAGAEPMDVSAAVLAAC